MDAQSANSTAQPTFGILDGGSTPTTLATVTLTASSTAINIGDTFTVDVQINTGNFLINEYRLVLNFDAARLSVVDSEPNVAGNQIEFLDSIFDVESGGNSVTAGKINLTASTPSGNALQVNRTVARIKFQAQSLGTTTITPASGVQGTQLINQNGIALATTLNSVTVVLRQGQNTTVTTTTTTNNTTTSSGSNTSTTTSNPGGGGNLPDTGIGDSNPLILIMGAMLVILGINLSRQRKRQP